MLQGGTSSSKTYTIMQLLDYIADNSTKKRLITVYAESVPAFKAGVRKDLFDIKDIDDSANEYNSTDHYLKYDKARIEFKGADKPQKAKGPRRDILYLNECNNYHKGIFDQTEPRTKECIFMDWNPESKFYAHDLINRDDVYFDISTHWDNQHVELAIRQSIEGRKITDPEWYRVYGEGKIGQYEGLVFKRFRIADLTKLYQEPSIEKRFGLDFGYSPDPNAFIVTGKRGDKVYIFKEIVVGLIDHMEDLAKIIKPFCGGEIVWCDGANPRDIAELKSFGINARKADKRDRKYRLNWLKGFEIVCDYRAKQCVSEYESFSRVKDKNGEILPLFQDGNDHCIDSTSYAYTPIMLNRGKISTTHIQGL